MSYSEESEIANLERFQAEAVARHRSKQTMRLDRWREDPPPPITTVNSYEILSAEYPPRSMILPPWLPEKGLAMIHAPRGIGKTHMAVDIAWAVATGRCEFLRWKAPKPRKVLLLDGEMPAAVLQERVKAVADDERHRSRRLGHAQDRGGTPCRIWDCLTCHCRKRNLSMPR